MQIAHGAPGANVPEVAFGSSALPMTGFVALSNGTSIVIARRNLPLPSNTWMRRLKRSAT